MPRIDMNQLEQVAAQERNRLSKYKAMLMVCTGTGCVSAKAFDLRDTLTQELEKRQLTSQFLVVSTGCNGFCGKGPIMVVQPEGVFYQLLKKEDMARVIDQHLIAGKPVEDFMFKTAPAGTPIPKMGNIPFFSKQKLIALRNKGFIDPENIDSCIERGGYAGLRKALSEMSPEAVLSEVKRSALRGRGGGGFPTGVKWESCVRAVKKTGKPPVIVCNADEGDPGAFMDRSIIETDPHAVIEGMTLGAFAVGATEGYVYIRKEYPLAVHRLEVAIGQARDRGLLGMGIFGTDFQFDIQIHRGAGAFVCGESTALMASMEGRVGEPRAKYIHNVESGYKERPTVLNNVETYANVPAIIEHGGAWFAGIGTGGVETNPWDGSSGTKVFSLVGNITNTGLVEVPMGMTLREIIFDIGGGIPNGRKFKAVQTGGPSGGCLPASFLDQPVDFDTLTQAGSMMGSGGMIVMDDQTCMVDVAKYFVEFLKGESCGKCLPCREGTVALYNLLTDITEGRGTMADIDTMERLCRTMTAGSLCQLGGSAGNPVLSTLRYFRHEYEAHIKEKRCPAGVCKKLITFTITKECTGCGVCKKKCPSNAIQGEKKALHVIDPATCIQCGICKDVCKFAAVQVH